MLIAWIATTTHPDLIDAFRRGRWEIKSFLRSESVSVSIDHLGNFDAIVYEINDTLSVDLCRDICEKQIAPILAIVTNLACAQAALEAGADDFVVLPVNPIEAVLRLHKLVRAADVVRVRDLEIDLAARRVLNRGQRIRLSPVEFRILACLAKRVGRMATHVTILDEVWGWEAENGALAQIKSYIGRVRRKIEPDLHKPQYIITIPKVGYRLRNQRQWKENQRETESSNLML